MTPGGALPRTHWLLILNWVSVATPKHQYFNCPSGNEQAYNECVLIAEIERDACIDVAANHFASCITGGAITALGTAAGCVIGGIKAGGPGSLAAVKTIVAYRLVGFIAGFVLNAASCFNTWHFDYENCYVEYTADIDICYVEHCK